MAATEVLGSIADRILALHGWVALAIVFLVPALEASAFVGFVFPGEIALLESGSWPCSDGSKFGTVLAVKLVMLLVMRILLLASTEIIGRDQEV